MSISKKIAHRGITDRLTMFYKNINSDERFTEQVDERTFENTLIAFILAFKSNFGIECDVQLTKDKELVIFHDFESKDSLVSEQNLETLRSTLSFSEKDKIILIQKLIDLRLINIEEERPLIDYLTQTHIGAILRPTLSGLFDVYKLTNCKSTLNLEIKVETSENDTKTGNIITSKIRQLCSDTHLDQSKLLLSSFNHKIIDISGYLVDNQESFESAKAKLKSTDKKNEFKKHIIIDDEFLPEHLDLKDTVVIKYNVSKSKSEAFSSECNYISDFFE